MNKNTSRKIHTLWSIESEKISKFDATRCQSFRLNTANSISAGAPPPAPLGELTALPQTPGLYLRGTSKGMERVNEGEGKKRKRKGEGGGKGSAREKEGRGVEGICWTMSNCFLRA